MHSRPANTICYQPKRRGLSFLETVGCLAAMSGGVVLGSVYLGVDLQSLANDALEQSESLELGFFSTAAEQDAIVAEEQVLASANTPSAPSDSDDQTQVKDENSAGQKNPAVELEKPTLPSPSSVVSESTEFTGDVFEQDTRKCWDALARCMEQEIASRQIDKINDGAGLLFDYLTQRKNAHEKAVETLELLRIVKVDDRLSEHVEQVLHWNRAGVQLYNRAASLLTDSPSENLIGPIAQSWQSSATQHRMEEKLMRKKHLALAGFLTHEYKTQAPFLPAEAL
jgi:hypothetical protein